ncbi:MAG: peptidylprolyl isomerase [Fimbriimonadaceae bacterium]|nr:peptidylprolyl isomerase [Fimbriimonadaceae bacterium]
MAAIVVLAVWAIAQAYQPKQGETIMVVEVAGRGTVHIKLHTKEAPNTTAQIMRLAQNGFYNGQRFFKVDKSPKPFLVQTGDPASKDASNLDKPTMGSGGSGTKVAYEDSGFANQEGSVGLSTKPNDRDSGDSQFYILLGNFPFLDGSYTVFGKVVSGMDVVKKIERGDVISSVKIVKG